MSWRTEIELRHWSSRPLSDEQLAGLTEAVSDALGFAVVLWREDRVTVSYSGPCHMADLEHQLGDAIAVVNQAWRDQIGTDSQLEAVRIERTES